MGKQHHGHGHHAWHSHHSHHHHHHHHHHGAHDYMFGTRADDVLNGGPASDILYGLKGNDQLFGDDGNDWLIGGRGNDLLDGGRGHDKVFGGKGDDVAVYSVAENADNSSCGKGDFYDGGGDNDTLRLVLTAEEMDDPAVKADLAAFEDFLKEHPSGCGGNGAIFKFSSFDLAVRNFENLETEVSGVPPLGNNTPPDSMDDTPVTGVAYVIDEDGTLEILDPNAGVLANDSDADGDVLSAVLVKGPDNGTLNLNADGTFTYTPATDFNGVDGFIYRASDGVGESADTNVAIEITPVNDPPRMVVTPDWSPIDYVDKPVTIKVDILSFYSPGPPDESGQTLDFDFGLSGDIFPTLYGVAGRTPDNMISYTAFSGPPAGGVLHDSFEYNVTDSAGEVTTAIFDVDIM